MLDQGTARALLTIVDECQVHLALLGDRHQIAAVGRGGVLDLAAAQVDPTAHLTLVGGAGERVAVVVATREQTAALNAAIRDRLVTEGRVDDRREVVTGAGERIGVGDRIATRRNNRDLDVANRDVWTVTGVGRDGGLVVTSDGGPHVTPTGDVSASVAPAVPPAGTGARALPADYVTAHVELAYATTAHGAQGDTVTAAHLVIGEHTGAAAAYAGMTRGRTQHRPPCRGRPRRGAGPVARRLSSQVRVRAIRLRPGRTDRLARRACAATWASGRGNGWSRPGGCR